MMSIEFIVLSVVTIINLAIVWIIASQSWHISVNRYFILAASGVILWSIGSMFLIGGSTNELMSIGRMLFLVVPMYTIFFLSLFASIFPKYNGRPFNLANTILGTLCVIFSLYVALEPDAIMPGLTLSDPVNNIRVDAFLYSIYAVYFNVAFMITFGQFFMHLRSSKGHLHQQVFYVFIGTLFNASVSLVTNLALPIFGNTDLIWVGPASSIFYIGTVSFSIVKHQLFDIKLAAVRTIAYIGALLTLSAVYYLSAYLFSMFVFNGGSRKAVSVSPVNIILALGLAFLFQPIKRFFDRTTNSIFYRQQYNSEEFFARFSELLSSTTDLRGLLERASHQLATTFKADQAFFFVYYADETVSHHMSAGTTGHSRLTIDDARLLDDYISQTNATIFMVDFMTDNLRVRRLLKQHHISVVMTLRHGDTTTGYVFLGEHLSGAFTKRDLNVLSTVSNELVIAIQNALSLQELKDLNATLKQRIDVATKQLRASNAQLKRLDQVKDEFMSMASHQLRTPLTSIKGYLSMVLEGDAGKLTAQQRKLLVEAFNSSERMVRLIADFLNVSRLQTGKFLIDKTPFDIGEAVKQETANLQLIAESHTMRLHLDLESTPLSVVADEQKIRQVVMNLIDNAIYYSHPNSIILVKVERIGDDASFTVTDTGIGIAEKDQPKLFTKFFRAENARKQRPDGTGVGLYLARRVVGAHDGKIILSSIEGKGSTFGFQLPLAPKNGGGK